MAFMQIEVSGPEYWIILDGPCGGEMIPCDVCGRLLENDDSEDDYIQAAFAAISEFTENRKCWEIEEVFGYAGRLSAPGYLDCTDWMGPYDSAEEARLAVIEAYELCPVCEEYAGSPNLGVSSACNFYHY